MLAVLLKKHYNTRVAEIDTKVSSLDGKIIENKAKNESINNELKKLLFLFLGNIIWWKRWFSSLFNISTIT